MSDPIVSVGLVARHEPRLAAALVRGLLQYGPDELAIHVTDHTDEDEPNLKSLLVSELPQNIREIPNVDRLFVTRGQPDEGYPAAHNRMAELSRSRYHVTTSESVYVGPEWWDRTVRHFDNVRIAAVGAWPFFGKLDAAFTPQGVQPGQGPEYLEGWWTAWDRRALDRHGLYDAELLPIAGGEDADACLRYRNLGWQIKAVGVELTVWKVNHADWQERTTWGAQNLPLLARRWGGYFTSNRSFARHTVVVPAGTTEKTIQHARWKYPFSDFLYEDRPSTD